jgi:hypothetical protein
LPLLCAAAVAGLLTARDDFASLGRLVSYCLAKEVNLMKVEDVMEKHQEQLMTLPDVVGVGVGEDDNGRPVIVVMVKAVTKELKSNLPANLEGFNVKVDVTGEISAF